MVMSSMGTALPHCFSTLVGHTFGMKLSSFTVALELLDGTVLFIFMRTAVLQHAGIGIAGIGIALLMLSSCVLLFPQHLHWQDARLA